MAFDGIGYRDAPLGFPHLYHPKSPLVGPAYGNALRIAYCYAHNHGRRILDQHYAWNFRAPNNVRDFIAIVKTTYARTAEGFRYIPDGITHLVAEAIFNVGGIDNESIAYHRLKVSDGVSTDTGTATETQISVTPVARGVTPLADISPFSSQYQRYVARCEVALSAVTTGAVREVIVEGYAVRGANAASYYPQFYGVWTEIR